MTRQRKRQRPPSAGPRADRSRPRTSAPPTRVRATSPGDLLGLVPYLLGFSPRESLVLVLIKHGQVQLTARIDLPPVGLADEVLAHFVRLTEQHQASGLVLLGYSDQAMSTGELLRVLISGLEPWGLVDALYVDDQRWWSLMCTSGCCPDEGTAYELASHPTAAEAVYAGLTAAPDRTVIEESVAGPAGADVGQLTLAGEQVARELRRLSTRQRCDLMSSAVGDFLAAPGTLADADLACLAVLAADVRVRDVAWGLMSRHDIEDHLDLWGQVVRRSVSPWDLAPLCLLGMAGWISGNGALLNCCLDRALSLDPSYSMAGLLADISQGAISPRVWDTMAAEMRQVTQPLLS